MSVSDLTRELGLDRYDRNARLQPALAAILPIPLALLALWPASSAAASTLVPLGVACGGTFLLAQVARNRGRQLERRWGDAIGRRHSARLLAHADHGLSALRKQRVGAFLAEHHEPLPMPEEETQDAVGTDERRLEAVRWLLEVTRDDAGKSLLLQENIAYGFWRNLAGLRPFAIAICLAVLALEAAMAASIGFGDRRIPAILLAIFCGAYLVGWLVVVRRKVVEEASLAFAERLFAQVDNPALRERLAGRSP